MKKSRRSFLKIAGAAAVGAGFTTPVLNAYASKSHSPYRKSAIAKKAHHWGMVIDTTKFKVQIATAR